MKFAQASAKAALFDRWKNRPLPDPNRPRPVLDAIKGALTELVKNGASTMMPMLLQLAQKYLSGLSTPSSAEASLHADTLEMLGEEIAKHGSSAASTSADWVWLGPWLEAGLKQAGPVVIMDLLMLLNLTGAPTTAAEAGADPAAEASSAAD